MPGASSVSLGAWVRVGGRDESADIAGASHFLEHLLFKGTERRSAREIAASVDSVGGEMNAFTSREHTAYYARLPHAELARGIAILGDVRSEEHTSELQSLMRSSYAVFCLKKTNIITATSQQKQIQHLHSVN